MLLGSKINSYYFPNYLWILEKKWGYNGTVHQLFIDFKRTYDSFRKKIFNSIIVEFRVSMKLVRLIK
jgi:hypothetical protein